jgi:outer membrane protein TolC
MKKTGLVVSLLIILNSLPGFSEDIPRITLEAYLEEAVKNHPSFVSSKLSVDIGKKRAESLLGEQDWSYAVGPYYSYLGESSAPEVGQLAEAAHFLGAEAGLNKPIWPTGGNIGFLLSSAYSNIKHTYDDYKYYKQKVGVTYTQPLLQNFGGRLSRFNYEQSGYEVDSTRLSSLESREGYILDFAELFLSWVELVEKIRVSGQGLEFTRDMLNQIKERYGDNLAERVDLLRAEDAAFMSEQNLLVLESQLKAKQAELAVFSGMDEIYQAEPEFELYSLKDLPEIQPALSGLKQRSRALETMDIFIDQLQHRRRGLLERQKPQLNLSLSATLSEGDEELAESFKINKPDGFVYLELSAPLGNRSVKAELEKNELEIEQLQKDKEGLEISLEADLRSIMIQIREMEKVLALNRKRIELAKAKREEELSLYNQGRGELTFVLQSRESEENAKMVYVENSCLYHLYVLQYRALMDELLPGQAGS